MRTAAHRIAASVRRHPTPTYAMLGWWDADHTDLSADAAAVASWVDRSGSGRTLTQATGANQPTYRQFGLYGQHAVRGDGSNDRISNTSSAPFAGREQACQQIVFASGTAQTNRYYIGQAEATVGSNGIDTRFGGTAQSTWTAKTNSSSAAINLGTLYDTAARPVATECHVDLTRSSSDLVGMGSSTGFNHATLAGATLDASAGEFTLFDFGSGAFSAPASIDIHEMSLLTRPPGLGERRRWWRYIVRRWKASPAQGAWNAGGSAQVF